MMTAALLIGVLAAHAPAQLRGKVTNGAQVPLADASIQIDGTQAMVTDQNGDFGPLALAPGTHLLHVEREFFSPLSQRIDLRPGETSALELSLQLAIQGGTLKSPGFDPEDRATRGRTPWQADLTVPVAPLAQRLSDTEIDGCWASEYSRVSFKRLSARGYLIAVDCFSKSGGVWFHQRVARLSDGLVTLELPVLDPLGRPYQQLSLIRSESELYLVPALPHDEPATEWLKKISCSAGGLPPNPSLQRTLPGRSPEQRR